MTHSSKNNIKRRFSKGDAVSHETYRKGHVWQVLLVVLNHFQPHITIMK